MTNFTKQMTQKYILDGEFFVLVLDTRA